MWKRIGGAATALGLVLALAPAARAQESPLAAVPADSPIVVQVRGFERVKDRVTTTLKAAVPDLGPFLALTIDAQLRTALMGRDLKGVAKDGPIFIAFPSFTALQDGGDEAAPAVLVRVSDFAAFRDGIFTEEERKAIKRDPAGYDVAMIDGKTICLIDKKEFAVLTTNKTLAGAYANRGRSDKGLAGKLNKAAAGRFLDSDVAAYVDLVAVNKQFGDQLKGFRQLMELFLQQAEGLGGQGLDKQQVEQAKAVFNGLFQVIEDGSAFLAGVDFRPTGLALHLEARFGPETKTNEVLAKLKPAALNDIATLPSGDMVYTASEVDENTLKLMGALGASMGGGGSEALKKTMADMVAAGQQSNAGSFSLPAAGIQVARYKDPARAVSATSKMFQALEADGTFANVMLKGKPEFKADAETHRGFTFNYVRLRYDLEKMLEKQIPDETMRAAMTEAMKKLMGTEVQTWFGTDGKTVATLTGKDWASARKRLDDYLDGKNLAKDPSYQQVRRELPAEESMIVLIDAPRFTVAMGDYMTTMLKAMPGLPFPVPNLKPVKAGAPSFVGLTVSLRPEEASFDLFVPAPAIQEVRKIVEKALAGAE